MNEGFFSRLLGCSNPPRKIANATFTEFMAHHMNLTADLVIYLNKPTYCFRLRTKGATRHSEAKAYSVSWETIPGELTKGKEIGKVPTSALNRGAVITNWPGVPCDTSPHTISITAENRNGGHSPLRPAPHPFVVQSTHVWNHLTSVCTGNCGSAECPPLEFLLHTHPTSAQV